MNKITGAKDAYEECLGTNLGAILCIIIGMFLFQYKIISLGDLGFMIIGLWFCQTIVIVFFMRKYKKEMESKK